jgi:type VI secretion system secreted protein VgrG
MTMAELYTFTIDGVTQTLHVVRFRGSEGISTLFRFEVEVACDDPNLALAAAIGQPALLTMQIGPEPRHVHGMVLSLERAGQGKKLSYYRAVVVPELWKADQNRDIRIFQELDAGAIIDKVLGGTGAKYRMALSGGYATRTYCVQYRESDWAFVSRLMEEEGIFAFFEHGEGGHELVVADAPGACGAIPGASALPFRPPSEALAQSEHVHAFRYRESVAVGKSTLTDYDFEKPSLDLTSTTSGAGDAAIEVYDYPGNYVAPRDGSQRSKALLEQLQLGGRVGGGSSGCVRFVPGHTFSLEEHPSDEVNRGYLLTQVEHRGAQPDSVDAAGGAVENYANEFVCIPDDAPFRAPRRTVKPTINGIQTAIVVGPAGEEIHTDEHGRVKVQFHWDRLGNNDENSSCWIRVSQAWAGGGWGALYIPRIGHEVVVSFLEGDPDRPIVTGSVYHGTNVPPYQLPAEKTKSTLKSQSSLGGGGFNEIRFEDRAGSEEIYLHGQKDWTIAIENDKNQTIGRNETLQVGANREKSVTVDETETIGGNKTIAVSGQHNETITLAETINVGLASTHNVGLALTENVGGAKTSNVGGVLTQVVGAAMNVNVVGASTLTVGAAASESVGADKKVDIAGALSVTVGADRSDAVGGDAQESVEGSKGTTAGVAYVLQVGKGKLTVNKDGTIVLEGSDISIKGSGNIVVEGAKLDVKSSGTVSVKASGAVKVQGGNVAVN